MGIRRQADAVNSVQAIVGQTPVLNSNYANRPGFENGVPVGEWKGAVGGIGFSEYYEPRSFNALSDATTRAALTLMDAGVDPWDPAIGWSPWQRVILEEIRPPPDIRTPGGFNRAAAAGGAAPLGGLAGGGMHAYRSYPAFLRGQGPAGPGRVWHDIVSQHGENVARFGPARIHSSANTVSIDKGLHDRITGYMNRTFEHTGGKTVAQWLRQQPFADQERIGRQILDDARNGRLPS